MWSQTVGRLHACLHAIWERSMPATRCDPKQRDAIMTQLATSENSQSQLPDSKLKQTKKANRADQPCSPSSALPPPRPRNPSIPSPTNHASFHPNPSDIAAHNLLHAHTPAATCCARSNASSHALHGSFSNQASGG